MSSVILGIMGVILFIGLAIAGASYLGSGVTDAKVQSNTANIAQTLSQYSAMSAMYRVRKGQNLTNSLTNSSDLINANIAKTLPYNPLVAGNLPFTVDSSANLSVNPPAWVLMYLGTDNLSRDVCIELERASGRTDRLTTAIMQTTITMITRMNAYPGEPGCARSNKIYPGTGSGSSGDYVAYYPA